MRVKVAYAPLYENTKKGAERVTTALFGQPLTRILPLRESDDPEAWIKVVHQDGAGYEGFVRNKFCFPDFFPFTPTHRVSVPRSVVYRGPSERSEPEMKLSLNASVCVREETNDFVYALHAGWIPKTHLLPCATPVRDWVALAQEFTGTPYVWGGNDANEGIDCSALVQLSLLAAGYTGVPRDSGDQQKLGTDVDITEGIGPQLSRGDLIFWRGHVGIITNPKVPLLVHATGSPIARVVEEPLTDVIIRRLERGRVLCVRRL